MRPLAALASQQVIVTPTHAMREVDPMGWTKQIPRSRELLRALDDSIAAELAARGLATQWVFPPALVRAAEGSPSYKVDPYMLAAGALRTGGVVGNPVPGNLATQLRTMIALQESARAVLIPVELRFERDTAGLGVAVLHVALVDGRLGQLRWIGDVRSAPLASFTRGPLLQSIAAHFADLIAAP